jgi:hypothetical protein
MDLHWSRIQYQANVGNRVNVFQSWALSNTGEHGMAEFRLECAGLLYRSYREGRAGRAAAFRMYQACQGGCRQVAHGLSAV